MYEVHEHRGFDSDTGDDFDGWTVMRVSAGQGWGIGHTFREKASAEKAALFLNDLVGSESNRLRRGVRG